MKIKLKKNVSLCLILCVIFLFSSCDLSGLTTDFSSVEMKYNNDVKRYYYNLLSDNAKIAYTLILNSISEHPEKIEIPSLSEEDFNSVFYAISYDNPSILCLGSTSQIKSQGSKSYFIPVYSEDVASCNNKTSELNSKVNSILQSVPQNMSEYDKELYVHDYICKNCSYDSESDLSVSSTAYEALIEGKTVCEGYARAAQLLLNGLEIKNYLITGDATNSEKVTESHMWNIVTIGQKNYHLDLTWDDYDETGENLSHSYFNVSDDMISANHFKFDPQSNNCISTESNFFVKSGLLFSDYSSSVDSKIISESVNNIKSRNAEVEICFTDKSSLSKAQNSLIDNSNIYDLLDIINRKSKKKYKDVKYTLDEDMNVLQFIFE